MSQGSLVTRNVSTLSSIGISNTGAFGDLIVTELTPTIQIDFIYGINTQTGTTSIVTTGVADTDASRLRLQTGTGAAGSAVYQSYRVAKYRQGEGMVARFTAVWASSATNSTQVIGMGNAQVGYFFGFNGTAFGISLRNGGSDNWVAQTAWNGDKCDGTGPSGFNWNKTLGNVMQIKYPYLGYGAITFWVLNPVTNAWILCHTIQYPNSSASVQLSNASFPFYANAVNTGNTSNLIMYCGSVGVFISGLRAYLGAQWAIDNIENTVTTETNVFTLRNATTYNGVANTGLIRLRSLSFSSDGGNGVSTLRLKKGATLGGSPSYTTISGTSADQGVTITSGQSVASYDVAGTTVSGGTLIFNSTVARNDSATFDMTPYSIFVAPGETLTFSGTAAASASIQICVNWNEDV